MTDLKLGRRPAVDKPALMLAPLLTGVQPKHPDAADHINIGGWQMLGNNKYGDCVGVTWSNVRRLMTRLAGAEKYPNLDAVLQFYKTQNPGFPNQDDGMSIQLALEELVNNGGPDGTKAVAFAKVDYGNLDEVRAAIAIFGYVWVGINVQSAQMDQFNQGQTWDYVPGSPDDGGHSIVVGAYDSDHAGAGESCVTWAKETGWTEAFWSHQVEEAWVVVWPEHFGSAAFMQGIDATALASAYAQLTGRTLPVPAPVPVAPPAPAPGPAPVPGAASFPGALVQVDAAIVSVAGKRHLSVTDWMNRHFASYFGLHAVNAPAHQVVSGREPGPDEGVPEEREAFRDSETGQFVDEKYAMDHPATTQHETFDA